MITRVSTVALKPSMSRMRTCGKDCRNTRILSRRRIPATAACLPQKKEWVTRSRDAQPRCERKAGRSPAVNRVMKAIPAECRYDPMRLRASSPTIAASVAVTCLTLKARRNTRKNVSVSRSHLS